MVRFAFNLGIEENFTRELSESVIEKMSEAYPHLEENKTQVLDEMEKEEKKFRRTLKKGLKEFNKIIENKESVEKFDGEKAFYLYETFGFPLEMTLEELNVNENRGAEIKEQFEDEKKKHQEQSRAGAKQKFEGGLADKSEETTKLHTTQHLLLASLKKLIDPEIKQRGSNITAERLRFDFNFDRKLTDEEVKKIEDLINEKISSALPVERVEMPKEEAEKLGAEMEFGQKYPDTVSVYFVGDKESPFSKEFCGGPHVDNIGKLGEDGKKFKIYKQENIGSGLRRIKARLE
jgi:alanyl-tRNA synthetase